MTDYSPRTAQLLMLARAMLSIVHILPVPNVEWQMNYKMINSCVYSVTPCFSP
jgi:hypothetical protein